MSDKNEPYRCPRCIEEGTYTGTLRFVGDPIPQCRNHGKADEQHVEMEPVHKENK